MDAEILLPAELEKFRRTDDGLSAVQRIEAIFNLAPLASQSERLSCFRVIRRSRPAISGRKNQRQAQKKSSKY